MSDKMKNVWEAALTLTVEERAELAGRLLETLDDDSSKQDEAAIDAAQDAEIIRRADEIDRGTAVMIPGDEAMRLFRERKKV